MTNKIFYPVTEEELDQIKNDCAYPECNACDGCEYSGGDVGCSFKGANAIMDEVIRRPPVSKSSRYAGVCALQDKCMDYADFLESIMDEIDNDDDVPCPIKCNNRMRQFPPEESLLSVLEGIRDHCICKTDNEIVGGYFCVSENWVLEKIEELKGDD